MTLFDVLPPPGSDPLEVVMAFGEWAASGGRPMYAHQEEAAIGLGSGSHVVLATPTGSGKSLAALAGIVLARNRGERAVWTAPIKALVAEKFFELADLLGPMEVGLAIGDASINRDARVLVCTAEVLANQALQQGAALDVGFACLDEFHYYADADRGWAWQVPLLELTRCQFLLASATLGDVGHIIEDLEATTGREVVAITSVDRPVPLHHAYRMTPLADTVVDAVDRGLSPVYVVNTSQADAIERAQALTSLPLTTRPQREAIAAAMSGVRLTTGFGQTLGRLLRNGVGVHHAGMLPRYRRLVERLAGEGLLPVISGTDTLGVGINIPLRTVVFSALTKFDGTRVRTLRAREFHQLAGRAGRPGFDPDGHVWAQAPEHVIENERALARAGDDPKARRKVRRAEAPKGFVHWDEKTFERLVAAEPEALTSRFKVTPDLVALVLARPDGPAALKSLLARNHDTDARKRDHKRRAIRVYRSLERAGVAERLRGPDGRCTGVRMGSLVLGTDEREAVRMSSALGPFAIEVIATFDPESPTYVLDVVSVVESVLDDPMAILIAQEKQLRAAEMGRMKAEGVPFEERVELITTVTWPKPLDEVIGACMAMYAEHHPWLWERPSPKSILREMLETGETFAGFIRRYGLERSEGLLLRYLTDAWRALDRSLPLSAYTDQLEDVVDWLRGLLTATDASLIDEWERLLGAEPGDRHRDAPAAPTFAGPPPAWRTAVRTAAFGWVELFALRRHDRLAERTGAPAHELADAMAPYWARHDAMLTDADARSSACFDLDMGAERWTVRQRFLDPETDRDFGFVAEVDIAAAMEEGAPTLRLVAIGEVGSEQTVGQSGARR